MPRGQGQPVLRGKGRGWVATQASVTHVSPFPRAIVVVAHFVCIKLITAWHAMLTMRAIARQRKRERERERGAVGVPKAIRSHRNAKTFINYTNF